MRFVTKSQSGMSILEVLVACAILGIVIKASMSMVGNSFQSLSKIKQQISRKEFEASVLRVTGNKLTCTHNFLGTNLAGATTLATGAIRSTSDEVLYSFGVAGAQGYYVEKVVINQGVSLSSLRSYFVQSDFDFYFSSKDNKLKWTKSIPMFVETEATSMLLSSCEGGIASDTTWSPDGSGYSFKGGNVGIGTNAPQAQLDIAGELQWYHYNDPNLWQIKFSEQALPQRAELTVTSHFRIMTGSPFLGLSAYGNQVSVGPYLAYGSAALHLQKELVPSVGLARSDTPGRWTFTNLRQSTNFSATLTNQPEGFRMNAPKVDAKLLVKANVHVEQVAGLALPAVDTNYKFNLIGKGGGTAGWFVDSDARLKKEVTPIEHPLELVNSLSPKAFRLKKAKKESLGFLAQDIRKSLPELVSQDQDGLLGVNYTGLFPILLAGYQELRSKVETSEEKLQKLTAKICGQYPDLGVCHEQ